MTSRSISDFFKRGDEQNETHTIATIESSSEEESDELAPSETVLSSQSLSSATESDGTAKESNKRKNSKKCVSRKKSCSERTFSQKWLREPLFKPWLQQGSNGKAFCTVCCCSIRPKRCALEDHRKTTKHISNIKDREAMNDVRPINAVMKISTSSRDMKVVELKLAAFIAEHCSIVTVDHLSDLIASLFKDRNAMEIKLHRTKCSRLIDSVLCPALCAELIDDVKNSYFSLIIDESTDVGTLKMLCLVIRYFSKMKMKVITTFYRIVCLDQCNSEAITEEILSCLKVDGLDISRLLGIGTDNASVMIGIHNSVYSRLRELQPNLVLMRCICHSLALAASKAVELLPTKLDFQIEQTYAWFSRSSKRVNKFAAIYKVINDDENPLKILKYSATRWLSRYECINRILAQWQELGLYFMNVSENERSYVANQLCQMYADNENYLYLIFLQSILKLVTDKNKLFQGENVNPLTLLDSLVTCYEMIVQKIVVPGRFLSMSTKNLVSFRFEDYLRTPETMDLNYELNLELNKTPLSASDRKSFLTRCQNFLVELAKQLRSRLPDSINVLEIIRFLDPAKAFVAEPSTIRPLIYDFTNIEIDREQASLEFGMLHKGQWSRESLKDPLLFWKEVYEKEGDISTGRFPNISEFALAILSLPFSNAAVERVFSTMNVVKTRIRNRLQCRMLDSILCIRYGLAWRNEMCKNFTVSPKMLSLFSNNMYDDECGASSVEDGLTELGFL